ncbi:transposase [Microcystis aeruginosa BLCCF158]|uniref:Transposase n=1 Tax=Microcystis aeruginosa BLCC-F158 TaxID=2755316 RepID=A0A841V0N5_MICAE|nr:transposase [Microcystis aeruginosa]MBC1195828.1 transposase [Microcystis aeruginosa BLCC-F158]
MVGISRLFICVLATNQLDKESGRDEQLLVHYKQQQGIERGFRFLKDPLFFASSLFLKTPERIMALALIMALCLLVYNLGQRQLRDLRGNNIPARKSLCIRIRPARWHIIKAQVP